ncbi:MAG: 23S rRNA (adenine(2503)-C(2))-methyltransferase RlmN [Pseudobdellovibrio sp.]
MDNSFFSFSFDDLRNFLKQNSLPVQGASLLYNWHYKKNRREVFDHQDLSQKTRTLIYETFNFDLPMIAKTQLSNDKTVKFLFELKDKFNVESVLIPFQNKYTLCLSSQVGCAMNCAFCFTGKQGFTRHLNTEEIVGQFLQAKKWLGENRPGDDRILNIVFMGQGEPLHNFDNVKKSAEIFLSQHGLSLASHKITISTSGYLPGLQRWKAEMPDVNIALSLHSPFTEKRNELIPINRKYPLKEVFDLVEAIPTEYKRFVTYEYLIIKNFNDSDIDAHATGELLRGTKAFINLIPFNPFPNSKYERPDTATVEAFKKILDQYGVPVTVRTTKGDEILAACGQLNTKLT